MLALFSVSIALATPASALTQDDGIRLVLRPVGQAGSYFDLTMKAGQARSLSVEVANAGTSTIAARTYAADVYTIVNGGFGGRLYDDSDSVRHEMEELAKQRRFPIVGPQVGRMLEVLTRAIGARRIFELGSGYGYSALHFARAAGPGAMASVSTPVSCTVVAPRVAPPVATGTVPAIAEAGTGAE